MIGYEDEPDRSAEICVFEIFGRDVRRDGAAVGMGVHPFGDPRITDDFRAAPGRRRRARVPRLRRRVDADDVAFFVDDELRHRRRPVAGVPDAVHARHLRVPGRRRHPAAAVLTPRVRRRLVPRLPPQERVRPLNRSGQTGGMRHSLYEAEHDEFRDMVRAWAEKKVAPYHAQWEKDGIVPRECGCRRASRVCSASTSTSSTAAAASRDFRYNAVIDEELVRVGASGVGFGLHNDIVAPVPARPRHRGAEAALAARASAAAS